MLPPRLFAAPAARSTALLAALVLAIGLVAGVVRVLPLLLAPGVPIALVPILARGIVGVSLEAALFVAPPLAWALTASRLVERGEARALAAIGVRPARLVLAGWPAALGVAAAAAIAAAGWGREAAAPGRLVRDLVAEARDACARGPRPIAVEVPMLGISWVCVVARPPLAVGAAPGGAGAFSAGAVEVSADLRTLELRELTLLLPAGAAGAASSRIEAGTATIRGVPPVGRASNLPVLARVALLAASTALLSVLAAIVTLGGAVRSRAAALVVGASAPAAALLVFSALERAPSSLSAYAAVPVAGAAAVLAAGALARRTARPGQ